MESPEPCLYSFLTPTAASQYVRDSRPASIPRSLEFLRRIFLPQLREAPASASTPLSRTPVPDFLAHRQAASRVRQAFKSRPKPYSLDHFSTSLVGRFLLKDHERIDRSHRLREPITIPGSVQPHGVLLVLRGTRLSVVQASANLPLFLSVAPSLILGQPVGRWFDEASANRLDEVAQWDDHCFSFGASFRTIVLTESSIAAETTSSWNWSQCDLAWSRAPCGERFRSSRRL
jgi:hypothetical protein